jgi:hypothetical protein
MIRFKKYNYFNGEKSHVAHGISSIVKFMELTGLNYLLITGEKGKDNCLEHYLSNKIIYHDVSCFLDILQNKSNLFRLDLLVVDLWSVPQNKQSKYIDILSNIEIPILISTPYFHYKSVEDVNEFYLRTEYKELFKNDLWISDVNSKWTTTIESLKKSYIRDKKIEGLLGE